MQNSLNCLVGEFAVAGTQLPEPGVVLQCTDDGDEVSGEARSYIGSLESRLLTKLIFFQQ